MISQFEEYPIKTSDEAYKEYHVSRLRDTAMHDLGVCSTRKMKSVITELFFPSLRCTAYTMGERINIWKGKLASNNCIY